ncbi:MAG: NUDIX domain-containing protein [Candidatus Kapaibacteriota bacterium]|jgi:dATP pyrophosphohydrolase
MSKVAANFIQLHVVFLDDFNYKNKYENLEHLILQRNSKIKLYPNIWQVITGTIEENETAIQTAIRELSEETGLVPYRMWAIPYLAKFYERISDTVQFSPTFLVIVNTKDVIISDEHIAYNWVSKINGENTLSLPSHKEGISICQTYLENAEDLQFFEINLSKYLK